MKKDLYQDAMKRRWFARNPEHARRWAVLLGFAVWAFFWAVRSGQFDDLDTPAVRILLDDEDADDD